MTEAQAELAGEYALELAKEQATEWRVITHSCGHERGFWFAPEEPSVLEERHCCPACWEIGVGAYDPFEGGE